MHELQKYMTNKKFGGYSDCIYGSSLKHPWWKGSTISNCIGICWGLFNADRGTKHNFRRIAGNAKDIYAKAKKDGSGYLCSYEPKSSSIACYNIGDCGHVVYVLWMFESGVGVGIESNYSGDLSNGLLLRVKIGNPKKWYKNYQGCIYDFS